MPATVSALSKASSALFQPQVRIPALLYSLMTQAGDLRELMMNQFDGRHDVRIYACAQRSTFLGGLAHG
ncbi:hypothetical protein TUM3794_35860 [Shewanella colwelliana]|uniref:Uncharacterized protein n=1 Tax=Shewanella colwelliana TaxID=23 RepID=A0ABQ4PEB7_SHECO|nr:hypothetical protein TUM3794_35860 [Shewanella colwelliana]